MRWVHVLLLTIIVLLPAGKATAKVYRCQGASGSTVLTAQPKGKTGCVAIDTATPPPPGGFTPPVGPAVPARVELPANASPASISAAPMVPRQPGPGILRYRRPLRRMPPRRPHQKRNVAHHASTR